MKAARARVAKLGARRPDVLPVPGASVRLIQPAVDDPAAVDLVVSILAELLARRRKR